MSLYLRTAEVGGDLLHSFLSDPKAYLKVNLEQEKVPCIRGLPTKQDMKKFKSKSLKLIKLKDFLVLRFFKIFDFSKFNNIKDKLDFIF